MEFAPYDRIAAQFAAARVRFQPREPAYLERLLENVPPGGHVLDLGCGTGFPVAAWFDARGLRVTGVDGAEAMLALARERLPRHRWIHARIEAVELEGPFDAAVCWDALFHLPRRRFAPVLAKLGRWLAPGARLLVSSGGRVDRPEGFTGTMFGETFYYDSLPPDEMLAAVRAAGFAVLVGEMCEPAGDGDNRGKWATLAERLP